MEPKLGNDQNVYNLNQMENKSPLIRLAGKYIPRERIISFWRKSYIVFPYININNPFCLKKTFPYFRRWLRSSFWNWNIIWCIEIELDNGKIIRQWFYDTGPNGYASSTNCEHGMADFIRNYY